MAETTKRESKEVEKIDFGKPFWMTVHQSLKKNNVEIFQGPNAEQDAIDHASDRAAGLNRPVAVVGPQRMVKIKPPVATAADMPLEFESSTND